MMLESLPKWFICIFDHNSQSSQCNWSDNLQTSHDNLDQGGTGSNPPKAWILWLFLGKFID